MADYNGLSAERVIDEIRRHDGNITSVAATLHCSRQTIYNYIHRHATVKSALEDARESMIDQVESVLHRAALSGEAWAVCFFLKTQAKHRGYVERAEVTGRDGDGIQVSIDYANQLAHKLNRIVGAGATAGVPEESEQ